MIKSLRICIVFTVLVFLLFSISITSQQVIGSTTSWVKLIGSIYEEYNAEMFIDRNGYIYIVSEIIVNRSYPYILIAKLSSEGDVIWAKVLDINNIGKLAIVPLIYVDNKGYIYIAGRLSPSPFNISSPDIVVIKFSPEGDVIWAKVLDLYHPECVEAIYVDTDGYIYVVGETCHDLACYVGYSTCDLDTKYVNIFVAKIELDGNVVWVRTIDGDGFEKAESVTMDSTGALYIGGSTTTRDGKNFFLVVKLDQDGYIVWSKVFGLGSYSRTKYIFSSEDGVYLIGSAYINTSKYLTITKLSRDGEILWSRILSSDGIPAIGTRGELYVAASLYLDTIVIKFDRDLHVQWVKSIYNPKFEVPASIDIDINGSVYILSSIISIPSEGNLVFEDMLLIKIGINSTTNPRIIDITNEFPIKVEDLISVNTINTTFTVSIANYKIAGFLPKEYRFKENLSVKTLAIEQVIETPIPTLTITKTNTYTVILRETTTINQVSTVITTILTTFTTVQKETETIAVTQRETKYITTPLTELRILTLTYFTPTTITSTYRETEVFHITKTTTVQTTYTIKKEVDILWIPILIVIGILSFATGYMTKKSFNRTRYVV